VPAVRQLLARGDVKPDERVVLFNTGSGIKYLDVFGSRLKARAPRSEPRKSGLGPAMRP